MATIEKTTTAATRRSRVSAGIRHHLAPLGKPTPQLMMLMLLGLDGLLFVAHLAHHLVGRPAAWFYDSGADHSWNELYLYSKWVWIALLMVVAWRRRRALIFFAFTVICAVLFLEDSMMFHERVGLRFRPWLGELNSYFIDNRFVASQVGELTWLGGVALLIVVIFAIGWLQTRRDERHYAITLAAFFALFAFFAVGIDSWHSFYDHGTLADTLLTAIEDGGELASMSPAVAYAFWLARGRPAEANAHA